MKLEIFSDIVCPWCFIMKRQLDRVLDEQGAIQCEVRWRPYQLFPGLPAEGLDRADYLRRRYGGEVDAVRVPEGIQRAAADVGLAFDYAAMKRVPNTFDAHRLMDFAYDAGCQHALAETLFEYHFCLGEDVGNRETLVRAAVSFALALIARALSAVLSPIRDALGLRSNSGAHETATSRACPAF